MHEFAKHLVRRYGLDEVRKWYFEVWNEPNLSGFWSGTKDEYFKLYKASADGLKSVDGGLRIGGPASSKANWIQDMIDYCTDNGVPLDFISTHLYPQDEQVDYPDRKGSPYGVGEYFPAKIKSVKEIVANSKRPDLEIHWTEWNTQQAPSADKVTWGDNRYVDDLHAAATIGAQLRRDRRRCTDDGLLGAQRHLRRGIHSRRTVFMHLRADDDPRHPQGKLQRLRTDATAWKAT